MYFLCVCIKITLSSCPQVTSNYERDCIWAVKEWKCYRSAKEDLDIAMEMGLG